MASGKTGRGIWINAWGRQVYDCLMFMLPEQTIHGRIKNVVLLEAWRVNLNYRDPTWIELKGWRHYFRVTI